MNFERQKRLVERLLARTRAGEIGWEETAADNTFQISFPNSSVHITSYGSRNQKRYEMIIIDEEGRISDTFDDEQLNRSETRPTVSWGIFMEELFVDARRTALSSDKTIEDILRHIG